MAEHISRDLVERHATIIGGIAMKLLWILSRDALAIAGKGAA